MKIVREGGGAGITVRMNIEAVYQTVQNVNDF